LLRQPTRQQPPALSRLRNACTDGDTHAHQRAAEQKTAPCYQLSEADCAIFTSAFENTLDITSFDHAFVFNASGSGFEIARTIVDIPASFTLYLEGQGTTVINPDPTTGTDFTVNLYGEAKNETDWFTNVLPLTFVNGYTYTVLPDEQGNSILIAFPTADLPLEMIGLPGIFTADMAYQPKNFPRSRNQQPG
jgi:hypothetical protein